ncbi:MAG: dTMP kinase [Candidatus Auribacterota bacterium]
MKGLFITFEGPEGCGKTTQAKLLADLLASMGYNVTLTQDPGGSSIGDKVRKLLLDPLHGQMAPLTELFLFLASRHQLVEEIIRKELEAGNIVISSRYTDATLAYQGYGRKIDLELLKQLNDVATNNICPDLTILLDIDPQRGIARARCRQDLDRIEDEEIGFHETVRQGYLELCRLFPERIKKVDADDTIENVQAEVKELVIDVLDKI